MFSLDAGLMYWNKLFLEISNWNILLQTLQHFQDINKRNNANYTEHAVIWEGLVFSNTKIMDS